MKDMDKAMNKINYINEFQSGVAYSIHPRKVFIKNYVSGG